MTAKKDAPRSFKADAELMYDLWSDVNQPGALDLTLRNVSYPVAMVVKRALERDAWQVQLRAATRGPQAGRDRLLPPMG